jgi:hypothetical protein
MLTRRQRAMDGITAMEMARRDGRSATLELLHVTILDVEEGDADEEVYAGAEEPAVRPPPMICTLG